MWKCTVRLRASNAITAVLSLVSHLMCVHGRARLTEKEILAIARAIARAPVSVSALDIRSCHLGSARHTRDSYTHTFAGRSS